MPVDSSSGVTDVYSRIFYDKDLTFAALGALSGESAEPHTFREAAVLISEATGLRSRYKVTPFSNLLIKFQEMGLVEITISPAALKTDTDTRYARLSRLGRLLCDLAKKNPNSATNHLVTLRNRVMPASRRRSGSS